MKCAIFALVLGVALAGCKAPPGATPGRYVLKDARYYLDTTCRKPSLEEVKDVVSSALRRIQLYCQDVEDIRTNKGRCVVAQDGLEFRIVFDERDYRKNVHLKVHPMDAPGIEASVPTWVVLDKTTAFEHRWFYGDRCPVSQDRMRQILMRLYGL